MELIEAKILFRNILKRVKRLGDDNHVLDGSLTDDEITALQVAFSMFDSGPLPFATSNVVPSAPSTFAAPKESKSENVAPTVEAPAAAQSLSVIESIKIDSSILNLPAPPLDRRLCFDFGTAMSKVTLVLDETQYRDYEDIQVLKLGIPGDQEDVSETMLISSVFIDGDGLIWFGDMAVKRSRLEAGDGSRQRLDNIKHFLSVEGDGLRSVVTKRFNPTDVEVNYGDMILAYLSFLTWTVNKCLSELDEPRNLTRRFAMPCFDGVKSREVQQILAALLGEAAILADTFSETMYNGIPLADFMAAVRELRKTPHAVPFIGNAITEPLGVAGSLMSWKSNVNALMMVVDVGAGTSDFSLYRMSYDEDSGRGSAVEVQHSTEGLTEAGNYLDRLLNGFILQKANVNFEHPNFVNFQGNIELDLRGYKERLFQDGEVTVRLFDDRVISISLDEFMSLDQVTGFANSLIACRDRILQRVDSSFVDGAPNGALAFALTGGGALLPMVQKLAEGKIEINGKDLNLKKIPSFPEWLKEDYPDLELDYPRIAVSLGGARKRIIQSSGVASVTAGDIKSTPRLGGFY